MSANPFQLTFTPIDELPKIRTTLKQSFKSGKTRPLAWRKEQLSNLVRMLQENHEAFAAAEFKDMGKPKEEVYPTEIVSVIQRACESAKNLEEWSQPRDLKDDVADWQKSWSPKVHAVPKGVALIIAPWNYPIILSLQPLLSAITAGCCAVIKPSELAPHYAALLAVLLPKYLDPAFYKVANAEIEGTTKLLELQWDHIIYTGNSRVAKIIAAAAAKWLTPLTLELGGKSPVIVDHESDLKLAARRIVYGKINNCGQICVSPDYVLIQRDKQDILIEAMKEALREFFPNGALNAEAYAHLISRNHFDRVSGLLSRTQGQIVFGGKSNTDSLRIEPTIVKDVTGEDSLMQEEIFGPLLPIVPVDNIEEAVEFVNDRPHPLVLYCFAQNPKIKEYVLEHTTSGDICFNDTFGQMAANTPFGGIGESGYGKQVMRSGFDELIHLRTHVDIPLEAEPFLSVRYPPFNSEKFTALCAGLDTKI